jgi:hypothetical protein
MSSANFKVRNNIPAASQQEALDVAGLGPLRVISLNVTVPVAGSSRQIQALPLQLASTDVIVGGSAIVTDAITLGGAQTLQFSVNSVNNAVGTVFLESASASPQVLGADLVFLKPVLGVGGPYILFSLDGANTVTNAGVVRVTLFVAGELSA